MKSTPRFYMK